MKRKTKFDKIFDFFNYIIMGIMLFAAAYPIYFVVIASISDPNFVNAGQTLLWPRGLNIEGYKTIFEFEQIWIGYKNSIIYTFFGTCLNIAVLIPASFALSRKELVGKKLFTGLCIFAMYFSGGTIPLYLLIKNMGLFNTIWSLILPSAFGVYNMIVCRSFFIGNVSEELYESVKIDGGGYMRFFFSIVVPLSKAIIAVMVLYNALGHWNAYLNVLYYIRDAEKYNLQLVLRNITSSLNVEQFKGVASEAEVSAEKMKEMVKYTTILVAALPMIMIYPFVQKYFVTGIMIGSVKG